MRCLLFKPLFYFSLIKLFLILFDDRAIVNTFWFIGGIEKEEETFSGKGKKKEQKRNIVICQFKHPVVEGKC